uniref:Evasin n=1 Tax=Rhipicephalus appendiculatus TaxID=34631 RepID=A0A131YQ01_RHIAP
MVELPSFSAMAFKASITVIAVVYAVQMLCGASENNENSSATTADGPQDDCDSSATTEDDTEVDYVPGNKLHIDVWHYTERHHAVRECHKPAIKFHSSLELHVHCWLLLEWYMSFKQHKCVLLG